MLLRNPITATDRTHCFLQTLLYFPMIPGKVVLSYFTDEKLSLWKGKSHDQDWITKL